LDELCAMLAHFGVDTLVDIRTIRRSRHNPQFNGETLAKSLPARGLRYVPLAKLGGLRRPSKQSPNAAWRNLSFRGYADHMLTAEFESGLAELRDLATAGVVAIMCAEAVPWRCHRSLVADALVARGAVVEHIVSATRADRHHLTSMAQVEGIQVWYPG
jgi:uncharacterized protein (DUF488 family)